MPPLSQGGSGNGYETVFLRRQLEASLERNDFVEKENQELRKEVARLKSQVSSLRAHDNERKSLLWKKIQNSIDSENALLVASQQKPPSTPAKAQEHRTEAESLRPRPDLGAGAQRVERVPKLSAMPIPVPSSPGEINRKKLPTVPAPPPPPPPSKSLARTKAVRRVPEVVELYRALTKKEVFMGSTSNPAGAPAVEFNRNMIGEIENRSTYLSAVSTYVTGYPSFHCHSLIINLADRSLNGTDQNGSCAARSVYKFLNQGSGFSSLRRYF